MTISRTLTGAREEYSSGSNFMRDKRKLAVGTKLTDYLHYEYSCQILCPTLKINILVLFRSNNNPCSWDSFLTFPQKTWISKYISLFYKLIKFLVTFQSSGRLVGSSTNRYTGNHNIWFIELLWTGVNAVQCAMVWTYLSPRLRREWWLQKEGINFQALHHHQRPAMPTYLHHCTSVNH